MGKFPGNDMMREKEWQGEEERKRERDGQKSYVWQIDCILLQKWPKGILLLLRCSFSLSLYVACESISFRDFIAAIREKNASLSLSVWVKLSQTLLHDNHTARALLRAKKKSWSLTLPQEKSIIQLASVISRVRCEHWWEMRSTAETCSILSQFQVGEVTNCRWLSFASEARALFTEFAPLNCRQLYFVREMGHGKLYDHFGGHCIDKSAIVTRALYAPSGSYATESHVHSM